jgi:hypothetical protein
VIHGAAKAWARPDLLIIDDVGVGQVRKRDDEPTAAHTLYKTIDRRHGGVSTVVTSNIALSDWGRYLGGATITAAILHRPDADCDRLPLLRLRVASSHYCSANATGTYCLSTAKNDEDIFGTTCRSKTSCPLCPIGFRAVCPSGKRA